MYNPDFWCVLKIAGDDPHYRVFGSWSGSYTCGSSWRMNSGITRCYEVDDVFRFEGSSGSLYNCHKTAYGVHWESQGVMQDYINRSEGKITEMPEESDWLNMDWIIT